MAEHISVAVGADDKAAYNEAAQRISNDLMAARIALSRDAPPPVGMDERFSRNRVGYGVARELEAMGRHPVSDALSDDAARFGIEFEHLGTTIGTVLHGVDLTTDVSDELIEVIRRTLLERKVIFFRDQHLDEDQQVAFGRRFGELDAFPFGQSGENPFILEIFHDESRPGSINHWHTDVTWMECPSLGSIAQCMTVPPFGGDTLFSDSHAAYQGLPRELKARIEHLDGVNDYRNFIATPGLDSELIESIKADIPFGVTHPLVRTHPETGKRALYIHGGFLRHESLTDRRTGQRLPADECRTIVAELLTQHAHPEYCCRFQWELGSIAFWDNRAVQHYAASDYYPHSRLLRRVTVAGDRPFLAPLEN